MSRPVFVTLAQLSRVRGVDHRNRLLRNLVPDGFLLAGTRKLPIYLTDDQLQQVATSGTKPKE